MKRDAEGKFTNIEFDRLWILSKVDIQDNGCWNWTGYVNKRHGYGCYRQINAGKNWLAHRFVFNIVNGYYPKEVLHSCDNRQCVNPKHLSDGSRKKNSRDMVDRGRGGSTMFKQQVPDAVRAEIKDLAVNKVYTQTRIAEIYKVDPSLVSRIKSGKDTNRTRFP